MVEPLASEEADITINRKPEFVWGKISDPEFFGSIFMGVSHGDYQQTAQTREQYYFKGVIAGRNFESSVSRVFIDEEGKKVGYLTGDSRIEIDIDPENENTHLRLVLSSQEMNPVILRIYVDSLVSRIKEILERHKEIEYQ
jgi:carbon monoxide dehydrogenase subunit G